MRVFVVYCHPSNNSFTYQVKESFLAGLQDAGYDYIISDLYKMGFNPVMSESEYLREAFYNNGAEVPEDVTREQEKMNGCDQMVLIYPDFWTASPAMLEGWFQRILTYGFAYGSNPAMKVMEKVTFLITMGGSLKDEIRQEQLSAMKTVMVGDRIHNRARSCEVYVFDEMTRGYGNDGHREENADRFVKDAYEIAKNL